MSTVKQNQNEHYAKRISIKIPKLSHSYPTALSIVNYVKPTYKLSICKYRISVRGPYLLNN